MENIYHRLYNAIVAGNTHAVEAYLHENPEIGVFLPGEKTWLHIACSYGHIDVVEYFLKHGCEINLRILPENSTPLNEAIKNGHIQLVRYLLSRGADPNIGRELLYAMQDEDPVNAYEMVKVLVENGADVNRVFLMFNEPGSEFTALTWAGGYKDKIIANYLRDHGAKDIEQNRAELKKQYTSLSDEVIDYFKLTVGKPKKVALTEIIQTTPPIRIHVIPAETNREYTTLFTTGMCEYEMNTPSGEEEYKRAELFIDLPAIWPLTRAKLNNPDFGWPIEWLRKIAKYPYAEQTWLGGPATVITNENLLQKFAPNIPFSGMLIIADKAFTSQSGETINLYRLTPLYADEVKMEKKLGLPALLKAFDDNGVSSTVDVKRKSVAKD